MIKAIDSIIAGNKLTQDILEQFNKYLSQTALIYVAEIKDNKLSLDLAPAKTDWNYIMSEIAASFVKMVSSADDGRFKRCENPDCGSVFYDSSKNKTRKWCCNSCSSLIKVRRHRQKSKN